MTPGEGQLVVVNAREDKRRRSQLSVMLGVSVVLAMILVRQPLLAGVPGSVWSTGVLVGAFLLAWRGQIFRRAHAMLRLAQLRRDGLAATAKLNAGDFAGAHDAFAKLLSEAQPLGAFHAVHVLMYGVTRFFEGAPKEGLTLASRALDSQWLDLRHTREVKDSAEAWRVLMLLEVGELTEARRLVEKSKVLVTGKLAVSAYEEKWEEVLEGAKAALADSSFPAGGRPTLAVLGKYAASKLGRESAVFQKVLKTEKPAPLLLQNPALRRFL
ncbi:MAG: hypothetical protein Q8N23_17695 [Archangium sp.]|nr:hypothetical protein [Archangium sp.]MDP3572879.1 hypothetical protein [Archangium sp.]